MKPYYMTGLLALVAYFYAPLPPHAQAQQTATATQTKPALTTPELKQLLSGNSLAGNGRVRDPAQPYDWIAYYAADGRLTLKLKPEWGGGITKGRWWMDRDGQQCRQFETGHKKKGCWRFYREGKFLRFIPSSGTAVEGRAVLLPGNALKPKP